MKVLHINATSHTGGAARAMQRLHRALLNQGHQTQFLVGRSKFPHQDDVYLIWDQIQDFRSLTRSLQSRIGNQIETYLGLHPWANRPLVHLAENHLIDWADVIDLRNLFGGFFNLWALPALTKKSIVVWRLPDLWALTGHCAYPYQCQRWITGCHDCPLLTPEGRKRVEPTPTVWDGTRRVWRAKRDIYRKSDLHIIVTTQWMKTNVQQSILADAKSIRVISNGVNLNIYRPISKEKARKELGIPVEKKVLLWAAGSKGNYRKGYHLAVEAMELLSGEDSDNTLLLTMGGDSGWSGPDQLPNEIQIGFVRDATRQALIYSAADAFLCTTLADAQPQTVLESLACGTPVVAFEVGPLPDMIADGKTGVLAEEQSASGLVQAVRKFFDYQDRHPRMRELCRDQALQEYDLAKQTQKYINFYEQLRGKKRVS